MIPKGLLVISPRGQEFPLVPEEQVQAAHYTLSVLQRRRGRWIRLQAQPSHLLRESMLGTLLEFFGNLCRILNQTQETTAEHKTSRRRKRQARSTEYGTRSTLH